MVTPASESAAILRRDTVRKFEPASRKVGLCLFYI